MSNERWVSPLQHTIAYELFKKHFTEINKIYWAFVPASNTIESNAKKQLSLIMIRNHSFLSMMRTTEE